MLSTKFGFPQIKFKSRDVIDFHRVKHLESDLKKLKKSILSYAPSNFNSGKLNRLRIRIFKFSKKNNCEEFFIINGNKKYICLNAFLLNSRYYTALQYLLHGIAHSFSCLKEEIAEEAFCEFVSYSLLRKLIKNKSRRFSRRIIRSIMKKSQKDYNKYYRAARKLERKKEGTMLRLNQDAKNRKISKKKQKKIFRKFIKTVNIDNNDSWEIPELEKAFRKI